MPITDIYGIQFGDNIQVQAQQMVSKLRDLVTVKTGVTGKSKTFEMIGRDEARTKTTRHADVIYDDPALSRVTCYLSFIYKARMLDPEDELKIIADPRSVYTVTAIASLRRRIDGMILDSIRGTRFTGEAGTTPSALPASQQIAPGTTGMTIAKLLAAKEILDGADIDEDEPRFLAVSPRQVTDLLNTTQVTSSDFNTVRALAAGQIDTFLGFKFIRTNLLTRVVNNRFCVGWTRTGVGLAIGKDIVGRADEVQGKHYAWSTYASMFAGATRIEDAKVIEIGCVEA